MTSQVQVCAPHIFPRALNFFLRIFESDEGKTNNKKLNLHKLKKRDETWKSCHLKGLVLNHNTAAECKCYKKGKQNYYDDYLLTTCLL